ncbi:MAG: exopolysaccharide biosynthesis protein [Bacteroidales bacterium]|nr:exopolysaccharide biosynthesis protein [Bacteroidales bacterium]MDD4670762.1 exopolysaccharide biosynthesis protein [Bacteroidales bacterium]
MNYVAYIIKFLYRNRFWLIFCPVIVTLIVIFYTRDLTKLYESKTTIYTGIISGYDIESSDGTVVHDWNLVNSTMSNLLEIIKSKTTLNRVSMRLFAQHMMYGDPNHDNTYLRAKTYRELLAITPPSVQALIDKSSEDTTLARLYAYQEATPDNFVYGLFNWYHRHYSYSALNTINVRRIGGSDMIEISYIADDPGVAYHTLLLLNEEFVEQYRLLRFGETNNVIAYFERELARVGAELRRKEDSLTRYNVRHKVINYDEQTKQIAAMDRDYQLKYESILLDYNSAQEIIYSMEQKMDEQVKSLKSNPQFINKVSEISELTNKIALASLMREDTIVANVETASLKKQLEDVNNDLTGISNRIVAQKYTKEGVATEDIVTQWLEALVRYEQAKSDLEVMKDRRKRLDGEFVFYSPIGSTIKRQERDIDFTEQSYQAILNSLNAARLRQKNLQMSSATLKVLNPPNFPIGSINTKRRMIVLLAFFASFFFVLGFLVLKELFDRKLRDKYKAERITGGKVICAFPMPYGFLRKRFNKKIYVITTKFLGNSLMPYWKRDKPNVINLIGFDGGAGKTFIATMLCKFYHSMGMTVRYITYKNDFSDKSRYFAVAERLQDFVVDGEDDIPIDEADVVVVVYPTLDDMSIPKPLLDDAAVNLVIARADQTWKDTYQIRFNRLVKEVEGSPIFLCLNMAKPEAVETFTGQLPPYTFSRNLAYRIYQQGVNAD